MPNRIIKDSINTSQTMNSLSAQAERHWYRLLTKADDYGCFEATPEVIRGGCYVWQLDSISALDIYLWQLELEQKGLIGYWKDGKRIYGCFLSFEEHNTRYAVTDEGKGTRHRRKTPEPPQHFDSLCQLLPTLASLCPNCQLLPNPNPNPDPDPDPNPEEKKEDAADAALSLPDNQEIPNNGIPFQAILDDLNSRLKAKDPQKRGFGLTDDVRKKIRGRWQDKFRENDFYHVHEVMIAFWWGTKFQTNLNPDTLYRPAKFAKYRNYTLEEIMSMRRRFEKDEHGHKNIDSFAGRDGDKAV